MCVIKPTTLDVESHPLAVNKVNPIVTLSIYIFIFILIDMLFILGFISPIILVTALGSCLASSISTLDLLLVGETNYSMVS